MSEKKQIVTEEDLIAFLDSHMGGGGGAVKPKFDGGKMQEDPEVKVFTDGLDESCPTCASIPNLMEHMADNMFFGNHDGEE